MGFKRGTAVLLIGALGCGGAAAYLTKNYINEQVTHRKVSLDKQYEQVEVVVAKRTLTAGIVLRPSDLALRKVPKDFVHAEAIRESQAGGVIGHPMLNTLNPGEPLLRSHVAQSAGAGFSNLVKDGRRALTFPVDNISSVNGLLRPGDKIDLLATLRDKGEAVTLPLLKNVEILATGVNVNENVDIQERGYQTITLMVTPKEAASIVHAREVGSLTVTLRTQTDNDIAYNDKITMDQLLGKDKIKPKKKLKKKPKNKIEIILGGVNQ